MEQNDVEFKVMTTGWQDCSFRENNKVEFFDLTGCDASYGALTLPPVGLSPTEHASLCWTHYGQKTRAAFRA